MRNSFQSKYCLVLVLIGSAALSSAQQQQAPAIGQPQGQTRQNGVECSDDDCRLLVTLGKPRHWTLDDAYYLLSGVHERARQIDVVVPSRLDPNSFNSLRMEQLSTAASLAVRYDELAGLQNEEQVRQLEQVRERRDDAAERAEELTERRNDLRDERLRLKSEKARVDANIQLDAVRISEAETRRRDLETRLAALPADRTAERDALSAEIDQVSSLLRELNSAREVNRAQTAGLAGEIAAVEEALANIEADLTVANQALQTTTITLNQLALPSVSSIISAPQTSATANLAQTALTAVKSDPAFNESLLPSLHTSEVVQNYVTAENELLARQLTLLRSELGPGRTVVFLELPHSIYAGRRSRGYVVRMEWSITGVCTGDLYTAVNPRTEEARSSVAAALALANAEAARATLTSQNVAMQSACESDTPSDAMGGSFDPVALELIPQSNAYNTARFNTKTSELNLAFVFSRIIGLGADSRMSRRRELFEQFATQQVFASGYGQGSSTFGWILGPRPGNNTVSSGARTTFATVVVPSAATALKLQARYCVLKEKSVTGHEPCKSGETEFTILLSKDSYFWVERIEHSPVKQGEAATVVIEGNGFSPYQLSVLVDGHPLQPYRGTRSERRQPNQSSTPQQGAGAAPADSNTNEGPADRSPSGNSARPNGYFEVLGSRTLVLNFSMPQTYVGTPEITLVSPARAQTINFLRPEIATLRGEQQQLTDRFVGPMFRATPTLTSVTATRLESPRMTRLSVSGTGLTTDTTFIVTNDRGEVLYSDFEETPQPRMFTLISDQRADILVPDAKSWTVAARQKVGARDIFTASVTASEAQAPRTGITIESLSISRITTESNGAIHVDAILRGTNFAANLAVTDLYGEATNLAVRVLNPNEALISYQTLADAAMLQISQDAQTDVRVVTTPKTPSISSIQNPLTQNSSGLPSGGYTAILSGTNLGVVNGVFFGTAPASIVTQGDTSITVVVPPGTGRVQVIAATAAAIAGRSITNSADFRAGGGPFFEYKSAN